MTRRVFATMIALSAVLSLSASYFRGLVAGGYPGVYPAQSLWAQSAGIIAGGELQEPRYALPLSKAFERPWLLAWWLEQVAYRGEIKNGLEKYPNVEQAIRHLGLEPLAFVWAVIQIESSGNPEAVNPRSQAAGLMQVVPHSSSVPLEDLLIPGVGIAEGLRDLNNKLASNDGDLYEAMFDFSGGPRQMFQGRMVGWASKESFDERYWQRLLSAHQDLTGTRTTTEAIQQLAQIRTPPAEQARALEWTDKLTGPRIALTSESPKSLERLLLDRGTPARVEHLGIKSRQDDTTHTQAAHRSGENVGLAEE